MPLGFAILCQNTPICILLSCDPDLERAVRTLPGQVARFCSRYCLFIFTVHIIVNSTCLCSWQIQYGNVTGWDFFIALLFAMQSAILSVFLEWQYPIRGWKIESDLWHHPRKYSRFPGLRLRGAWRRSCADSDAPYQSPYPRVWQFPSPHSGLRRHSSRVPPPHGRWR